MLAQLIPKEGGPTITLNKPITVIGRNSKLCDLVVEHTSVSKLHCMLVKTDGLIYMRDLGSTNGTRVNGQRVIRGALLPGDLLSFSSVTYRVHLGPDQANPGRVMLAGATELIPLVDDGGLNDSKRPGTAARKRPDSSHSDVRFLRDSDLLFPD
jgi:pSer/pThr/pTyr-binding forkhead associated (FHA) protein